MAKRDYYEILGVDKSATDKDLKSAYRKLAKQYHPDANPDNKEAEEKFKEASEAYDVLSDQQKRSTYDQFGHSAFENGGGGGGGYQYSGDFGDFGDIFESFFGGGFGGGSRRRGPRRGADLQTQMQITFEEAIFGASKEIKLPIEDECETCHGSGAKAGTAATTCSRCNGTGQERVQQQTMFGAMTSVRTCSVCSGTGKNIKEKCPTCGGRGRKKENKTLKVEIPKGINTGQSIKLRGKGEFGELGGERGDLLVTIYVQPHKLFKRDGQTLHIELPISFVQATLGDEITVPTPYGDEKYTLKSGTQPGTRITIKNKGVTSIRNSKNIGDLIATLKIEVPTSLTNEQKDALEKFAETMDDNYTPHKKGFFEKINKILD